MLTLLRAFRIEGEVAGLYNDFMVAAPIDPWQDYDTMNNIPFAWRTKKEVTDRWMLGTVYASRLGFNEASADAFDYAFRVDTSVEFNEYHTIKLESAVSETGHNLNNQNFKTRSDDSAYRVVIASDMDPFDLKVNSNIAYTYMGSDFYSPLSNYSYTRDDISWGRHISFYSRSQEEENYRVGNSIDANRKVSAVDINLGEFEGINTYFNIRNVNRATDDKFIENIVRNETRYQVSDNLLTKFLFLFHNREKTDFGVSQDTASFSAAFIYDFTDWVTLQQMVERTNEYPGFPDGLYDWLTMNPNPPYPYFNIAQTRVVMVPADWIELAMTHTYNEFKYAATLDDFMNHSGIEFTYWLNDYFSLMGVYRYTKVADFLSSGKVLGHHNMYFDLIYNATDDSSLKLQFGALGNYIEGLGWQSSVLDTQHIVRFLYEGEF
ncbi:MAG: hypothetical protein HY810_06910 [Candidatus Omnitrophica bacterium]|nr:hypothetical protein [Candidatus Omnitrophota bacterium]